MELTSLPQTPNRFLENLNKLDLQGCLMLMAVLSERALSLEAAKSKPSHILKAGNV